MNSEKPKIKRPWGGYTILKKTKNHWLKKLFVNKNARLSLQSHRYRDEIWYILSGKIKAQVGARQTILSVGDFIFVPKNKKHRITGISQACILEVAFGKTLEKDIIRYADDYGRLDF